MDFQYIFQFLIFGLLIWNLIIQIQFFLLKKRIEVFFRGKNSSDLEGVISEQIRRLRKTEDSLKQLAAFAENLEKMAQKSIQKVGIVRFNPFKDTGGDQSFSIAFLDLFDNGVVISTLFTREGTRIYAKPIDKGLSKYLLSEEEKEAMEKAKQT